MDKDLAKILDEVAKKYGTHIFEVIAELQNAIDESWDGFDTETLEKQQELFPKGKPSIEEFIRTLADKMKD